MTDRCLSIPFYEDGNYPEPKHTKVVIIGAGNVAWHLAHAIQEHLKYTDVTHIYSRNLTRARGLSALIKGATATNSLDFSDSEGEIFLIAVPDAAIAEVVEQSKFPENAVVAHTSGSVSLEVLQHKKGIRPGVFYPLQTFTKGTPVDFKKIPFLIEGEKGAYHELKHLARDMSAKVLLAHSDQRQQLHLAAVFACNFTNHLLGISGELLEIANLDTSLLRPLIVETIYKALNNPPFEVQTGPAVRGDKNVINRHLHMLQQHPNYQEIYDVLSASIEQKKGQQV